MQHITEMKYNYKVALSSLLCGCRQVRIVMLSFIQEGE